MPLGTNAANHASGSLAVTGALVIQHCRRGLREKTTPFGHQEAMGRNAQGGVMMEASPATTFIVPQAEFLLQFLIVALNDPAMFRQMHQFHQGDIGRDCSEPVLGRFGFSSGPLYQQPLFRMWLGAPIIAVRGTYPHGSKSGL